MKRSLLITHEGWFLFCPVYWSEQEGEAIPRSWGTWGLFDAALELQQFRNWCLSWFGIEGGFPFSLKPLVRARRVTVYD